MASGTTNRGRYTILGYVFRAQTLPTNFYVALVTSAVTPTVDTNVLGDLTQIASGNGYTSGGFQLSPNATDFDTLTEDDTADTAFVQCKDVAWTAAGGSIPSSGGGARWGIFTDDNATIANRIVFGWVDLTSDRTATVGQVLTLPDVEYRIA